MFVGPQVSRPGLPFESHPWWHSRLSVVSVSAQVGASSGRVLDDIIRHANVLGMRDYTRVDALLAAEYQDNFRLYTCVRSARGVFNHLHNAAFGWEHSCSPDHLTGPHPLGRP